MSINDLQCVLQFGRMDLVYDDVRYMIHSEGFLVWVIPLTYLSHEAINWICTTDFTVFPFIRFYFGFLILL